MLETRLKDTSTARSGASSTANAQSSLIIVKRKDGSEKYFTPTADTNAARAVAISNALAAAVSNDTILVGPGTYGNSNINHFKNGVNWYFYPGAVLVTSSNIAQWTDSGNDPSYMDIDGAGWFRNGGAQGASIFNPQGADSRWVVSGYRAETTSVNESTPCINPSGGYHKFYFSDYVRSLGYDGVWNNGAPLCEVYASLIEGSGNGVECQNGNPLGTQSVVRVVADTIKSGGASNQAAVYAYGLNNKVYVKAREIYAGSNLAIQISSSIDDVFIEADNIFGQIQHEGGSCVIKNALINVSSKNIAGIVVTDSGLTLQNVSVITNSSATNSITATSDRITVLGTLLINRPADADTIFTGGIVQELNSGNSVTAGASPELSRVGGVLFVQTTSVGNVTTGEDDLITYAVVGSTLNNNLDRVDFNACGVIANNTNNKRIKVWIGSHNIFDTGLAGISTSTAVDWELNGSIIRVGQSSQKCSVRFTTNDTAKPGTFDYQTATNNLGVNNVLKITGSGVLSSDVAQEFMTVNWFPGNV